MNFFKRVLSSLVAIWLAIVLFVLVGVGIAVVATKDTVKEVKANSVLELNLVGELNDYSPTAIDPFSEALGFKDETFGFNQICKTIENATYDDKIKGISIKNIPQNIGWAQVTALRGMLEEFKKQDKFVYAYSDVYSQKQYYLYSVADQLFISPLGYVELRGLHSEVMFYKDFQEKYGVKMEVIRHGKYKSAVEPFIANKMSDANKEQISELINGLWLQVDKEITSSRAVNVEEAVLKMYGQSSKTALEHGLVDAVMYEDDYKGALKSKLETSKLNKVSFKDYMAQNTLSSLIELPNKIAVVYAQGEIRYGQGNITQIGQESIIRAFNKAAKDESVKAIVFRINSPGGSALASDLIWNAVEKAKEKKPVIVSMGNLAASGGYYVACGADRIFAEPTTITGSIGVFGILPNVAPLADKMGLHTEVVSTHDNGIHYSPFQPLDKRFKGVVKSGIESVYANFLDRVSKGRDMTNKEVDAVAQGRVWTGNMALEVGLVDELGSLDDAIAYAAEKVNIKEYSLKELPKYDLDFKKMLGLSPFAKADLKEILPSSLVEQASHLKSVFEQQTVQARVPFELRVE
ncbi:signal peptide peptidase SppA [Wenyingzhuangia sp. IMCC45574]